MGWHKLLMKRGLGSPGYIAKKMAKTYRIGKQNYPEMDERTVIRRLFVQRVYAQSVLGGPALYKFLKKTPAVLDTLVDLHPDLFSIVILAIFIEHPELVSPGAPTDAFSVLTETVQEIFDAEAPGWRVEGVWSIGDIVCSQCHTAINHPNSALMAATINAGGAAEYWCAACAPPVCIRVIQVLGRFAGRASGPAFPKVS